ncbi:long-chain-fatty-acid--CoA ligase [Haloplanus salilacus]|uniref:long-chain-fatty-acid--CoA ligase n=1 Tax=Haloplanus salilacus TaxID=2949994 RepID=UPI0030CF86E8
MSGHAQTLRPFLSRAVRLYPDRELVARTGEGVVRHTYDECADRVGRLANALRAAGVGHGDRVGTLCWNHDRHFAAYFAAPELGAQLHTINPLLPADDVRRIVESAGDRVVIVDASLADAFAEAYDPDAFASVEQVVVVGSAAPDLPVETTAYDDFVAGHAAAVDAPDLTGDDPAGLCYSSGTTGDPKGVEYTHRMLWSHTMAIMTPSGLDIADRDVVMPVVPMFHINAWGLPYAATAAGAKHVYPGPSPDPQDIVDLIDREGVTLTAGVPTVWLGVLDHLSDHPNPEAALSTLDRIVVGGAAPPERLLRAFDDHGVEVLHGWGMTETSPVGAVSHLKPGLRDADYDRRVAKRAKQGLVLPGLEFDVVDDSDDAVPHDGESMGELLIRGPWVATEYYESEGDDAFEGPWLRTGDVVTVDSDGYLELVDRADDVIKSGGEWISSQAVENAIMDHESVREAAVVGVPHERWGERPAAFVAADADPADRDALVDSLCDRIRADYPDWWVPDRVEFVESVPKTATGKFDKVDLRGRFEGALDERVDAAPPEGAE